MKLEAAHADQVRTGRDGKMHVIDRDAGGVVDELKRIDPGLNVRFSERGKYFVVYYAHCSSHKIYDQSCPVCLEAADREAGDLVTTVQAYQSPLGIWEGLDGRLVDRIRKIGQEGYDYAKELAKHNEKVDAERRHAFRERVGPLAEQAAHAVRKDLGSTARAFIPRDLHA